MLEELERLFHAAAWTIAVLLLVIVGLVIVIAVR